MKLLLRIPNNNILKDMYKNKLEDKDNMSLSEIQNFIKEELGKIHENDFDRKSEKIKKDWGGETEPVEEFDAEEFFGKAGDAAEDDIRAEFGDDEFTPFGTMEDPRMLKNLEEDGEETAQPGLFKPQDAEGNDINLKTLVKHVGGNKTGRVIGFGDDGKGSLVVRVDWAWPTDMKFTDPGEMGEKREDPGHLIVQNAKPKEMNEEINEEIADMDASEGDAEETIEEMRGLGAGVKNSGDRNVKQRDDHAHAPLTNLNESLNKSIKNLMEGKVTKKALKEFIAEEAKKVAKNLKG